MKTLNQVMRASAMAVALIGATGAVSAAEELEGVSRKLSGERLNELGIWDLGGDNKFEVFVSGVTGNAGCYHADTLEPLWEKRISTSALTAPVIGNFMGTGAPILAFGASTGEVYFVWPATGLVISKLETGSGFTLPPAVATFEEETRDAVVLADDRGQLIVVDLSSDGLPRLRWTIPNTVEDSTAFSVVGRFAKAPSCADLNDDGTPEVVVSSESGIVQVVSLKEQPTRHFTRLPQQSRATTLTGMGPLGNADKPLIVIGVQANLELFDWTPDAAPFIKQVFSSPAFGNSHGHLLLARVNNDPARDLVSSADSVIAARYLGKDLDGKELLLDIAPRHLTTTEAPLSPAVLCKKPDGATSVVSIDDTGSVVEWQPGQPDGPIREVATIPVPTGFTPAGNLAGDGKLTLITWTERGTKLSSYKLPIEVAADSPAMLTLGDNYSRNGQWDGEIYAKQQDLAAAALAAAKEDYKTNSKDSEHTTTPAAIIAGIAPNDPVAAQLADVKQRFSTKVLLLSLVLSVTGIAALSLLWHFYKKRH